MTDDATDDRDPVLVRLLGDDWEPRGGAPENVHEIAERFNQKFANPADDMRTQRRIRRQEEFLQSLLRNMTIPQCCEQVGISERTYSSWRRRFPDFKDRVDEIRRAMLTRAETLAGNEGGSDGYDGSFESFRRIYMGFDTFPHQQDLVDILDGAAPMSVTLVTYPPEHGKTTTLEDFICWKLGEDPEMRFGIVSERANHGTKMIGRVQTRMTEPEFTAYQARFGPFHPDEVDRDLPWRATAMTVARKKSDERDFSIASTGWRTAVSGSRYDRLLVDDIQSVKSLNLTGQILDTLRQDHFTRVGRNGAIVIVATRVGDGDIYQKLLDEGVVDHHVMFPAVKARADEDCTQCGGHGVYGNPWADPDMPEEVKKRGGWTCNCRVLCPQMWDGRSLDLRRKQVGERIWHTTYQQTPQAATKATFTDQMWTQCLRTDLRIGDTSRETDRMPRQVIVTIDPALDGGNAMTCLSTSTRDLIVTDLDVRYGLGRYEAIYQLLETWAMRYRPYEVIIETMAFQKGLAREQRLLDMASQYGFHILPHETRANKTDPSIGVAAMDRSFMRQEILLPNSSDADVQALEDLKTQLLAWRPNVPTRALTQDAVMALWFGWKRWQETVVARKRAEGDGTGYRRSGVPGGATPVGSISRGAAAYRHVRTGPGARR